MENNGRGDGERADSGGSWVSGKQRRTSGGTGWSVWICAVFTIITGSSGRSGSPGRADVESKSGGD